MTYSPNKFNFSTKCSGKVDISTKCSGKVDGEMKKIIGEFAVPLETRFSEIRTKETNMGKMIYMFTNMTKYLTYDF